MQNLKTDWITIGSSGPTVDGRSIQPAALESAAKTYDPAFYTALMFPDHERMWAPNFGKIDSLRSIKNPDGSVSLQAIIVPNENYIYANRNGQYLYSSMELRPDFPKPGDTYLVGCAPTDKPASTRTLEIRFSAESEPLLFGEHVPVTLETTPPKPTDKTSLFKRLFGRPDETQEDFDMADKAVLTALQTQLAQLSAQVAAFTATGGTPPAPVPAPVPAPAPAAAPTAEEFAALQTQVADLTAKITALTATPAPAPTPAADPAPTPAPAQQDFKVLTDAITALQAQFTAALSTPAGNTPPPANPGGTGGAKAFL